MRLVGFGSGSDLQLPHELRPLHLTKRKSATGRSAPKGTAGVICRSQKLNHEVESNVSWLRFLLKPALCWYARPNRGILTNKLINGGEETMTGASACELKRGAILNHVSAVVSAYVSNHTVAPSDFPSLIEQTFSTLSSVTGASGAPAKPTPAVPIKKSISPDFIVCLEDGRKLKMLKRHLKTAFDMTPEQYRERWGLSPNYPMVSPNYAKKRSLLAKKSGLGTWRGSEPRGGRSGDDKTLGDQLRS